MRLNFILFISLLTLTAQVTAVGEKAATQQDWEAALSWAGDSSNRYGYMENLAKKYADKTGTHIALTSEGSIDGIKLVKEDKVDMGGTGRYATDDERNLMRLIMLPVAWDALVVIVNKSNPIESITLEQLRGVYSGEINNWSQLGGPDAPIELHTRISQKSGVGYTIRKLLFANFKKSFIEAERYKLKSSDPLEISIERNSLGIGVTGISSAIKKNLKILKVNNIYPTLENIRLGKYLFYRSLYLTYNPTNSRKKEIESFIKFVHSTEGQKTIRESGTIPYLDAVPLLLKQIAQDKRAQERGLYR